MLGSCVVYGGLVVALAGAALHAGFAILAGLAVAALGLVLPAPARLAPAPGCRLDRALPAYEFHEHHERTIPAEAGVVLAAARAVSADEIRLLRGLMWLRSLGRSRLLGPRDGGPVLLAMQRSGFVALGGDEREIVVGAVGRFWAGRIVGVADAAAYEAFDAHGFAKAATHFRIVAEGPGWTRLATETRIHGTDAAGRRRFAMYWRLIYPGTTLIRRMWLRAIGRRAAAGLDGAVRGGR